MPWSRQAVSMHSHWYCKARASSISDKGVTFPDISTQGDQTILQTTKVEDTSGRSKGQLTVVVSVGAQHMKFMTQHLELQLDVGAILLREQGGEPCLDLGLLVQQVLDGGIQGRVIVVVGRSGCNRCNRCNRRGAGPDGRSQDRRRGRRQ